VLSAIAVPGFSKISTNKTIRTEAHGILTGLDMARTEAIFRNASVSFTLKDGIGWAVATVSPVSVIRTHMPTDSSKGLRVTTSNNQTSVVFNSLGVVSRYDASMALTRITVTPPPGTGGESLQIDVSPGGQIRMCNPAITAAEDLAKC
jgi:type IV fimbrial biogenesis protein FimT